MIENDLAELLHKAALKQLKQKDSPFSVFVETDRYDSDILLAYFGYTDDIIESTNRIGEPRNEFKSSSHNVEMSLKGKDTMYATLSSSVLENGYYLSERSKPEEYKKSVQRYRKVSELCGAINMMVSDNNNLTMQILDKYNDIHNLRKTKININEYKDLQKKFEEERWNHSIEDYLKNNDTFNLVTCQSADNYFKGYYYRDQISKIKIPHKQINNYHNTILLYIVDCYSKRERWEEKKYVKGEKVYEILKEGQWKE